MPQNIADVSTFTDPITAPADGDPLNAASIVPLSVQGLADRTRYLFDKFVALDRQVLNNFEIADFSPVASRWLVAVPPRDADTTSPYVIAGGDGATSYAMQSRYGRDWTTTGVTIPVGTSSRFSAAIRRGGQVILGSDDGYILRSTIGLTFANEAGPGLGAVREFAHDSDVVGTGAVVLAITDQVGLGSILRSVDDGNTWTAINSGNTNAGNSIAWDPIALQFLASFAAGEIRTSPDGITWSAGTAAPTAINGFVATDGAGTIVLYGKTTGGGYYVSTDSGATWGTLVAPPLTGDRGKLVYMRGLWLFPWGAQIGLIYSPTALAGTWVRPVVDCDNGLIGGTMLAIVYGRGRYVLAGSGAAFNDGFVSRSMGTATGRNGQSEP